MAIEFGKIEVVDLREAWQHEANDFTPWLDKNLKYISDAIGIPLETLEIEASVDRFYADILARNLQDGSNVVIENQLELSDHTHLGQILTYLAGLEARTVIWVASGFEKAHLEAIRWLNENTAADFSFFAVDVIAVKIGDSPLAPMFVVLEYPASPGERGHTELGTLRHDFWATYSERHPNDGIRQGFRGSNVSHNIKSVDARIRQYIAQGSVGICITSRANMLTDLTREHIRPYLPNLMRELGIDPKRPPDSFGPNFNFSGPWIAERYLEIDVNDRGNWHSAIDWLHKNLEIYRRVLSQAPHG